MRALLAGLIEEADDHAAAALEKRGAEAARQQRLQKDGAAIKAAPMWKARDGGESNGEEGRDEENLAEQEEENGGRRRARPSKRERRDATGIKGLEDAITFSRVEEMEYKGREVDLKRLELEERKFQRERGERDRDGDREERKERLELEKREKLAMINSLTAMSKRGY